MCVRDNSLNLFYTHRVQLGKYGLQTVLYPVDEDKYIVVFR